MAGIFNPDPEQSAARASFYQADNRSVSIDPQRGVVSPGGAGFTPTSTGLPGAYSPSNPKMDPDLSRIPTGCVWFKMDLPPSQVYGIDPRDYLSICRTLTPAQRAAINAAHATFAKMYPWMPADELQIYTGTALVNQFISADARKNLTKPVLWLLRPKYPPAWDPILLQFPIIEPSDARAPIFEAALRLFFPDYVYMKGGTTPGAQLRNGKLGSMTPDGPFPYWLKFVKSKQIDALVTYVTTFPNAFGMPAHAKDDAFLAGQALNIPGETLSFASAGFSVGGPIGGIAGAAVGFADSVISFFGDLFGGDPEPPAWLKRLLEITRQTRTSIFDSQLPGTTSSFMHDDWVCHRAIIKAEGEYDLFAAYKEFLKRLASKTAGKNIPWFWLALGAVGIYVAS